MPAQMIVFDHVLVPDDKLERSKLVHKRRVYWEVERRVLRFIDGIEVALAHRRLEVLAQNRDDHEAT